MEENIEYVVSTSELSKVYNKVYAVDHVNMHIKKGSIYGFVGENGSGKTTIIRLLMGLALPTTGTYDLFNENVKSKKIYAIRNKISAIVEAPSLVPSMTAKENLRYACMYYGIKEDEELIAESLKSVGLGDTGKKTVKNFSLGMRQRELIIDLNKQGITFLISSHILSELEKVATHYGFISHGKLLKEISSEELLEECQKGIEIKHHDLDLVEKTLQEIGLKQVKRNPNHIRITDDITPLELLQKLHNKGIEISDIRTSDVNVEEYYLHLIGGKQNA